MSASPRGFERFQQDLAALGFNAGCDQSAAAALRLFARIKNGGIILLTGPNALVYAPWVMQGMSMTSRLIVHVDGDFEYAPLANMFNTDIRVAAHVQHTEAFLDDLSKYRFEMIVSDAAVAETELINSLTTRLTEEGVLMVVAQTQTASDKRSLCLQDTLQEKYFIAPFGSDLQSFMLSRFGEQQRASRKGGRRARQSV